MYPGYVGLTFFCFIINLATKFVATGGFNYFYFDAHPSAEYNMITIHMVCILQSSVHLLREDPQLRSPVQP